MLNNWLKILFFNLKRSKLFTLLTIVGLSFGICASILSTLYWKKEHSYDQWNPHKDLIYEVLMDMGNNKIWSANVGPLANQMMESSQDIVDYLYYYSWTYSYSFQINGNTKLLDAYLVSGNFFEFFPFEITQGSKQAFVEKNKTIAISEEEAVRIFGNENPIGKTITNEESISFVITTVYKPILSSSFTPKALINNLHIDETDWNNFNFQLLIKVKHPDVISKVQTATENIVQKNLVEIYAKRQGLTKEAYIEKFGDIKPLFTKLTDARLFNKNSGLPNHGGNYKFLIINIIVSILLLVLSIANQINLNTAYAIKRLKEFSIRRIIGATKKDVVLQLLFETSVYVLAAFILAFALIEILLPFYNDLIQHQLNFSFIANIGYIALLFMAIILCSAILPALYILRISIQNAIKGKINNKRKSEFSRQILLILQFAISFLFVCSGIIIYKQVNYMMNKELGFNGDQLIAVTYNNYEQKDRAVYYEKQIINQIKPLPNVKTIVGSNLDIGSVVSQSTRLHYKEHYVQTKIVYSDYDFLPMLDVTFLQGRNFDQQIASDSVSNIILNETAVKELGLDNPINETIICNNEPYTIIGVVKDFQTKGFTGKTDPTLFIRTATINNIKNNLSIIYIKLSPTEIDKTIANIEKIWNEKIDPYYPMDYSFVNQKFERSYGNYIKQRNLFAILNVLVISIALFGLFSLASFSIERRIKEIAIKKVLGAETKSLIKDLTKSYIWICIISFLIACIPSYYIAQEWLNNFSYRIEIDYMVFVLSFCIMFVMTLIIVVSKGYAATKINPINCLKYE